jgi:hypothetical protein
MFAPLGLVSAALDVDSSPPSGVSGDWFSCAHCSYGGVTDGVWWLGSSLSGVERPSTSGLKRTLRHVLSLVHAGRPLLTPPSQGIGDETDPQIVMWEDQHQVSSLGLLPTKQLGVMCICPSVFGKSKWVARQLEFKELLQALDIAADLLPLIPPCQAGEFHTLPFARSAPSKIEQPFASNLLCRLATVSNSDSSGVGVSTISTGMSPCRVCEGVEEVEESELAIDELPPVAALPSVKLLDGRQQAVKADDVDVPYHLWDEPFWEGMLSRGRDSEFVTQAQLWASRLRGLSVVEVLRGWLLRVWRRRVYICLQQYLQLSCNHPSSERQADLDAGRDCLQRVAAADFWDWKGGSRLFFWRWPADQRAWARDGFPVYVSGQLPSYR